MNIYHKIFEHKPQDNLFVWVLSHHSRIFHSYEDATITGEGLQILTFARHLWPLRNEGF